VGYLPCPDRPLPFPAAAGADLTKPSQLTTATRMDAGLAATPVASERGEGRTRTGPAGRHTGEHTWARPPVAEPLPLCDRRRARTPALPGRLPAYVGTAPQPGPVPRLAATTS
jgi:hypothetical protein